MQKSWWLRILGSFVVSVGLASAAGCGLGSPDDKSVAWADGMCTAVNGMTEAAANTPLVDMADPTAAAPRLIGYLDAVLPTLTKAVVDLKTLGPAPMDGGDEYVTHAVAALTTMQERYESVRTAIAAVDVSDEGSAVAALDQAAAPLMSGASSGLMDGFDGTPAFAAATKQAASCGREPAVDGAGAPR